jgi:hypothetical protein
MANRSTENQDSLWGGQTTTASEQVVIGTPAFTNLSSQ